MTWRHQANGPRLHEDSSFYDWKSRDKQLRLLLRFAILEPSTRDAQPWTFSTTSHGIDVYPDYSHRLPLVDPDDRELLMIIGAAIMNFRVAAANFGLDVLTSYNPGCEEGAPVAHISVRRMNALNEELIALFPSIRRQPTNRHLTWLRQRSRCGTIDDHPLDDAALSTLCGLASRFPDTLRLVSAHENYGGARLFEFAGAKPLFAAAGPEVTASMEPGGGGPKPEVGPGLSNLITGPWPLPQLAVDAEEATRGEEESSPALIVVTSKGDRTSLIRAGEVLEHLLLVITAAGLQYSFFSHPVELEELGRCEQRLAASGGQPQLVVRISGAKVSSPTLRRRRVKTSPRADNPV